jgi:phosphoglycerate dehydrogenase-like enzyme
MDTRIGVIIPEPLRERIFSRRDRERLDALGEVRWKEGAEHLSVEEAAEFLAGCTVGVGSWGTPHPCEELLALSPELKLWEHVAGSVKHMFGPHMDGRDLTIASCAPAIAECVAEITLGQLIVGLKRVLENVALNRRGKTPQPSNSKTLCEATVGIAGASHVGRDVIRLLKPFGSRILLYDPYVSAEEAKELGTEKVDDLVALCARSDAVSLHTPALESTSHIMGEKEFQAMPDDGVFINTSRGMCVDETALIAELEKGRLLAFLDVSDPEPADDDSPLRRLPNAFYTSHIAGLGHHKMGGQAVDDIAAFLQGRSPLLAVTEDMLDRIA